jgi:predicted dehydrogenase
VKDVISDSSRPVSVALVGIGGYGRHYLRALREEIPPDRARLVAAVEPFPELCPVRLQLKQEDIPLFPSLEELFGSGWQPDLVVIASPLHEHVPQSCSALEHGCHVLCDKPLGATVQDADRLIEVEQASGRKVLIGYQWSFSRAVQALKTEIRSGRWGRPRRFKSLCLWPRDTAYYRRNDWAGRIRDRSGRWVLDSPANNAMAHFLHNMLYLLGEEADRSAVPAEVTAEAYRVFPIENYDSVACRIWTDEDVELLFYASHAVPEESGPWFHLTLEDAEIACRGRGGEIVCRSGRDEGRSLGAPADDHHFQKLFDAVRLAAADSDTEILCGPAAARPQTLCVNGIQDSVAEPTDLSGSHARHGPGGRIWIEGLSEAFIDAYRNGVLPSEVGPSWTRSGETVDLRGYTHFPGGTIPAGEHP